MVSFAHEIIHHTAGLMGSRGVPVWYENPVPWLNCILYACDMKSAVITILIISTIYIITIIHYYLFISDSYS